MHHAELKWDITDGAQLTQISVSIRNSRTRESASCRVGVNMVELIDHIDELAVLSMALRRSNVLRTSFISSLMLAIQSFATATCIGHECLEYRTDVWGWAQVTG